MALLAPHLSRLCLSRAASVSERLKVPEGSAKIKAIDYSLNRSTALNRYIDDGDLPADNNWVENQIRPIATGRKNWLSPDLFARASAPRRS